MKLNVLTPLSILFFCLNIFSQTPKDRTDIISGYNIKKIEKLKSELKERSSIQELELKKYFSLNPSKKRRYIDANGRLFEAIDILDGKPIYYATDAINSLKAIRADYLNTGGALGLNLDGQDMHIGVWDGSHALTTHQEFYYDDQNTQSRITIGDAAVATPVYHATHVTGIIAARGVSGPAIGMATQATVTSYNWTGDTSEVVDATTNDGLLISNHSYGIQVATSSNWVKGCYMDDSRQWDEIAYLAPYYLQVKSAGNDGNTTYSGGLHPEFDKLTGSSTSKNNLVIVNVSDYDISSEGNLNPFTLFKDSSSSQGPTDDGRIKPDISADGNDVWSTSNASDTDYGLSTGTSMSAPSAAGGCLLLQQYNKELFGHFMKSSTLKGLVCHTSDDDHILEGPDAFFGWGLLNTKYAAETLFASTQNEALIVENTLSQSSTYTYSFSTDGSGPISATICWTDPAGTSRNGILNDPTPVLVNDLDLRIEDPSSNPHLPWKLQLDNITAGATTGDNIVDNIERVDINFPTAGTYTLTVSHKGSLTDPDNPFSPNQDYSLILTGANLTLSTEDNVVPKVTVWPNPTENLLNFTFKSLNNSNINISLIDIQGRNVYNNIAKQKSIITETINTKTFAKGVYFLRIQQGNQIFNKKIVLN